MFFEVYNGILYFYCIQIEYSVVIYFIVFTRLVKILWLRDDFCYSRTREWCKTEITLVPVSIMPVTAALWRV